MKMRVDKNDLNERHGKNSVRGGRSRGMLMSLLISVAIGIVIGVWMVSYMLGVYGEMNKEVILILYSSLAMSLLSIYLNILFHEAGHLIFGLLTGYSFLSFRIYSLTIIREQGKLRFKRFSVPGTAGQCLMAPPDVPIEELPYCLFNYGGVIINLAVSLLVILPMFLFPQLSLHGKFLLGGFAAGGILLGLSNGLPLVVFGMANDGYNVKAIKQDPAARNSFRLQLELVRRESAGERLKDMPEELFTLPEGAVLTNVMNAYLIYMAYNRNLDRMDLTSAKDSLSLLDSVLPKLPVSYRNITNLGFLFLSILNGDSKEETEQYSTKQSKLLIKSARNEINIRRIAYAYYRLYCKNEKAAEDCRRSILKLAGRYPIQAEAEMNLMLMEYIDHLYEIRTVNI